MSMFQDTERPHQLKVWTTYLLMSSMVTCLGKRWFSIYYLTIVTIYAIFKVIGLYMYKILNILLKTA